MSDSPALPAVVIAGFAALVYFGGSGRAPDKANQVALSPTTATWTGVRTHDDRPESTIEITAPDGGRFGLSVYDGGLLYQDRTQAADSSGWTYKWTVHRYPVDLGVDIGAWAGFRVGVQDGEDRDSGLDMGLRFSPVRLAYGVLAADILVSPRQAGVGVSGYAPAQSVPPVFQHLGVGVAYLADYDGGVGWAPYLALSTRF